MSFGLAFFTVMSSVSHPKSTYCSVCMHICSGTGAPPLTFSVNEKSAILMRITPKTHIDALFPLPCHFQPSTMPQTSSVLTGKPPLHSTDRSIFDRALKAYEEKTGKDLTSDPLLSRLETCGSPEDILVILRQQIPGVHESQSSNDGLTRWLKPTINVLHSLSTVIGGVVGLVSLTK